MPNPFSTLAGLEMEVEDHGFDNPDDTWETMDKPHNTIRQDQLEAKSIQTQGQIPAKLKHGRRFDLAKLRPFEAMFVDNKDFPCEVRGGCKTSLVLVDYKTQLILKVNVDSKKQNGEAFTKMMAICGVTKLPYKCTVYHDNDGAMKHVVKSAALLQIAAIPLPPHDQSANEAEKVCNYMWRAARMYMIDSRAPHKLFADAVDYAIYIHNRTASTDTRGRKTPHEMAFGIVPSIEHIYPFYTKTVVTLPKDIFQELVRKGKISPSSRGVPGRLIGYQHPLTRVPAVFTDRGFVIHNRSVTYQEDDVREPLIQLGPEGPVRNKTPSFFEAIITGPKQSKVPESQGAPIEKFPEEPFLGDDEGAEWVDDGEQGGARA